MNKYVFGSLLFCLGALTSASQAQEKSTASADVSLFKFLDGNGDGNLSPYEALDVLMQVQNELNGETLSASRITNLIKEIEDEERKEVAEMLREMDRNRDGKTTLDEMDEESRGFAQMLDKNRDGTISPDEAATFEMDDDFFLSADEIQEEVNGIFIVFDKDKDGHLTKDEAIDDDFSWSEMTEGDSNGDDKVTKAEMTAFLAADNQKAEFRINGDVAVMSGVINSETPATVLRLIHQHPSVRTIEMANVSGSIDDEANLRAARFVRKFGFTTLIKSNGSVASGGTDFFLAGKKRIVEKGGKLGIHSWGGPVNGDQVPKDDPQHQLYLKYYKEIGIPASFYWRTLEAAPANDIHWMTEKEIEQFNVRSDGLPTGKVPQENQKDIRESQNEKVSTKKQLQDLRNELSEEVKKLSGKFQSAKDDTARQQVIALRREFEMKNVEKAISIYRQSKSKRTNIRSMLDLASRTKGKSRARIFEVALEMYGDSEEMDSLLFRFGQDRPAPEVHDFLKQLANKSPHKKVKAWSTLYQAELALALREMQEDDRTKMARSFGDRFKPYEQQWLGKKGETRVKELLDICKEKFSTVGEKGNTVGDSVTRLKTKLRLGVGKVAPEIAGEDLDGKSFKLSDYRGKVVVLDFWGNW